MKNQKQNSNLFEGNKSKIKIPSKKYLNTIEECPETEDIIKKLEVMDFSTDKSFETPFISLSKTRDKIINKIYNLNKSISFPDLGLDNNNEIPSDMNTVKEEDINDSNYMQILSKFLNINKEMKEDNKNKDVNKLVLNEKINRIYMIIQTCNLNKNCLDKMNKFISSINNINPNLLQSIDLILEVIFELLAKIQEEYLLKNDLINKLNNVSLKKEDYEKQIYSIKNELLSKEKELEKLMDLDTNNNSSSKSENNNQQNLVSLINNTKKENQFFFEKILGYKSQIKKILAGSRILFEKHKICLEENEKLKSKKKITNFSKVNVFNFEIKGKIQNKKLKSSTSYNNIHINSERNKKTNNEKQVISLTNNLIKLVIDINSTLFKCDFNIIKISKNNKPKLNDIFEINHDIDINFLLQEKNFKLFSKYISCNLDIINNKIINLPNILFMNNNNRSNKDNKNSSVTMKNRSELSKNLNSSRINHSLNFFSPGNKNGSKNMKNYISLRKTRNIIRNQKLIRNATSRDGLTFMNFYNDNDLESIPLFKKNNSIRTTNKLFNQTVNLEKERNSKVKFG